MGLFLEPQTLRPWTTRVWGRGGRGVADGATGASPGPRGASPAAGRASRDPTTADRAGPVPHAFGPLRIVINRCRGPPPRRGHTHHSRSSGARPAMNRRESAP